MKLNLLLLPAIAGLSCVLAPAARADFFQAPYGPGGTWRIYETVRGGQSFKNALSAARASMDPVTGAVPGDLVSITSLGKNTFIYRSVGRSPGDSWIGLTDREGAAPGAFESQGEADNRMMGWAWTNGDPHVFQNYGGGEPNDFNGAEDASHLRGDGLWNDNDSGWGADDPIVPTVKPGTSPAEAGSFAPGFMVEYSVNSPTPIPGIRYGMAIPPCAKFNMPLNTAGNWSVREIRDLGLAGNIHDAVNHALSGLGTITNGQSPYLDFADPDSNGAGGPVLATPVFPYLSNTAGVGDDNVLSVASTRIRIDPGKAGVYTIRVHADDGFALRIKGVPWIAVAGGTDVNRGYIDPLDPTTLMYERGTGDANTMATINLAAGEYDVEFVHWEGGGGAFYEVTAHSGDLLAGLPGQWLPFGSSTDKSAVNTITTVRLAAPATVHQANTRERANALPALRYRINSVDGTFAVKSLLTLGGADMPNWNGTGVDQYITKVTGTITLDADADGNATPSELIDVTFRLNCDDGASLQIVGQDFLAVNAGGENGGVRSLIDMGGDAVMTADFPTGNTDVRGVVKLTEGSSYQFVAYMYEYGGGDNFNLWWQTGDHVDNSGTFLPLGSSGRSNSNLTWAGDVVTLTTATPHGLAIGSSVSVTVSGATPIAYNGTFVCTVTSATTLDYPLVGDPGVATSFGSANAQIAVRLTGVPDPVNFPGAVGALVENVNIDFPAPFMAGARQIVDEAIAAGITTSGTTSITVLKDSDDICCGRPGNNIAGIATVFPNGGPDNFVTRLGGQLIVDNQNGTPGESITLSFGLYADDGMELRIVGQDFTTAADFTGDGTATLEDVSGDMVVRADYYTGNCNAMGVITLTEGTYTFEATEFEGGGDSGMELWYAVGDFSATGFDTNAFRPITPDLGVSLPLNNGIPLIAGVDKDLDDDGIPGTWEAANGLSDANAADAALDTDGDGLTNAAEYAAGTLPADAASAFRITGVALGGGGIQVTAPTKAGHHYTLYGSPDMNASWTVLGLGLPSADGNTTWTVPSPAVPPAKYFFRVVAEPCD